MMVIIIIIPTHFIYVPSLNLHNSRKLCSLEINTRWNILMSLWNTGCCKSCIYKYQDSSPHFHPRKISCPSDILMLLMLIWFSHLPMNTRHWDFLQFASQPQYPANPCLHCIHPSHLFTPTPALFIQVLIVSKLDGCTWIILMFSFNNINFVKIELYLQV